jgi:hypothetical protein
VRKYYILTAGLITVFLVCSCAGVITFRNPKVQKSASSAVAAENRAFTPAKYEDFENGTINGSYSYGNQAGGASSSVAISTENPHSGRYCAKITYNTGNNSDWGTGFGYGTTYGKGFCDASGSNFISLWAKAPEGTTFYVFVNESSANGADGEFWNSPDQTGSGVWKEYQVPFDEFFRNIYSGAQDGNYTFDASGIGTVGAQLGGNQGKGVMYMDDIKFIKK